MILNGLKDLEALVEEYNPRTSDCIKDKVSFSPNTLEEETLTSAAALTTVTPSTSQEAIEDCQVVEEAEVEEEEEYDTDYCGK